MPTNILDNLNKEQKEAVTAVDGPVMVIAGPGSGKTKCLTHRIAHLISQGIQPQNILAVTFTNKAAEEMKERVKKLLNLPTNASGQQVPTIGTFHALCVSILKQDIDKLGYGKNFVIYDEADQLALAKKIIAELELSPEQFKPRNVLTNISRAKDELIDARKYEERADEYWPQNIARIYTKYQDALKEASALDFDDLIMLTNRLFEEHPEVLEKYQNKWHYLLVDEAHDTNVSQYNLAKLIAGDRQNIWIIADPDQSIYSWRGADFRNVLNFEKDYPKTQLIFLKQNYRSTKIILEASHHIISKNTNRKEKKLWTENTDGHFIQLIEARNELNEGDFLIKEINQLLQNGYSLKDFVVLYRTNAQSRSVEEAFLRAGLPYKIVGTVKFYERKEIKDILAYLKFIANPQDAISLHRIINNPPRRLARYQKQTPRELKEVSDQGLQNFFDLIEELRQKSQETSLNELINLVLEKTNFENYLRDGSEEGERRWENIQELFTVAAIHNKTRAHDDLSAFLEEITLLTSSDQIETNQNLVNLMTLHCAKGLEFPVTFIVGCEEGVFPHSRSLLDPAQLEEERRLFYVGLTRAQEKVYLSFARQRRLFGSIAANPPSRFIADLPEEFVEYHEFSF